jgi:hypothetical protein
MSIYAVNSAEPFSRKSNFRHLPRQVAGNHRPRDVLLYLPADFLEQVQAVQARKTGSFTSGSYTSSGRIKNMSETGWMLVFVLGYIVLMRFVLPKMGVPT